MAVWALADLHLSFGVPDKSMEIFGGNWVGWTEKIQTHWIQLIRDEDLVLLPGDISWAKHIEDAVPDLEWIDKLPGTKVMIRGNHDYWWASQKKVREVLPPSIHIIQNNAFHWKDISIAGARLWDNPEFNFNNHVPYVENPRANTLVDFNPSLEQAEKIFTREMHRLEISLKELDQNAHKRIAMTHYPPLGADMKPSRASTLLEQYHIDICVFGHLHNVETDAQLFGIERGIRYVLVSGDYLDFVPVRIL